MKTMDIINLIAIIFSPVIAVIVGQILQNNRKNVQISWKYLRLL